MCVPQPSSNGHSLFGFALCEHGEDQLLGKKAPSSLIETRLALSVSLCSCSLMRSAVASFPLSEFTVLIACLFEMCMSVLPITYVHMYVCVYCTVYIYVYMYAWCPGSQKRASYPLEVELSCHVGAGNCTGSSAKHPSLCGRLERTRVSKVLSKYFITNFWQSWSVKIYSSLKLWSLIFVILVGVFVESCGLYATDTW